MTKKYKFFLLFFISFFTKSYGETPLNIVPICKQELQSKSSIKSDWLFIVYIAGDNDLDYFARRNIEDMQKIGSNKNISIVIQLDRYGPTQNTKRLFVTKEALYQVNYDDITAQQKLNSGSAQTLIDCCKWAIESYPANHYGLVLWNHGTGILDSIYNKIINPSELFVFNPTNHMLELDRTANFFEVITEKNQRGVCFSDTYGSYLTNQKLEYALETIKKESLKNKKFDFIGFDACLMAMVEVADLIEPYAEYMVASQEVELGTGWPYELILKPFENESLTAQDFVKHIVTSYKEHYVSVTRDFTHSAINLCLIKKITQNIDEVSALLIELIKHQLDYSVKKIIRNSKSKRICTYFSEPSYIDLHNFYTNLFGSLKFIKVKNNKKDLIGTLKNTLNQGLELLESVIIANESGKNLKNAEGLSIYFPLRSIEKSYPDTTFGKSTRWINLLKSVL